MIEKFLSLNRAASIRATVPIVFGVLLASASLTAEAGDILRGGTVAASSGTPANSTSGGANSSAMAVARANSNDILSRTTQSLQALRAMQIAAHNLAAGGQNNLGADPNHPGQQLPNVPNGLILGGLVPDSGLSAPGTANPVVTWSGASTPVQTTSAGQTTVKITQTAQQAILNWQTFNVGKNTALNINQTAGGANANQWVAFNIVSDPSGIPSQILGSINAIGQVYVINQNGIIFGGASQVNINTLVASSLPINTNLVSRGLLNNPDDQFLFSQLAIPAISGGAMPSFTPAAPLTPSGRDGDVTVQAGAQLTASDTADNIGGRIAVIGPNVSNAGTISTPDGQTILAAGNQVAFFAHPSTDPSLRGLDVYVGSVDSFSGDATNSGVIDAPRADVTIAGEMVNQLGGIDSSTSVTLNGRIDLLADYDTTRALAASGSLQLLPSAAGLVTLGAGSVTQILPETSSAETVVGSQLAIPSLVNIQAGTVHIATNAPLLAPGASIASGTGAIVPLGVGGVALKSGVTINAGQWIESFGSLTFANTNGQIYLDAGAVIDVAGSEDVSASVAQNIVSAQLRGAELANSPLQREGLLRGQTVQVDITENGIYNGEAWVGTPVADVSGYAALIERTVGELTANGGSVSLNAGNSVVMQPGSTINVSGGWVNYQGATVQTTKLISGGHIYDISQATPDLVYTGILNGFTSDYAKWGIAETFNTPLLGGPYYEAGYVEGGNGGSVTITAPSVALEGNLLGVTVAGPRQQAIVPVSSTLSLTFQAQNPATNLFYSPTPPAITFQSGASLPPLDPFALDGSGNPIPLSTALQQNVILSPDLVNTDGFGNLAINNSDGSITVPANVSLTTATGGSITFSGANIDIEGEIISPGGNLKFNVYDVSPYALLLTTPQPDATRGNFILGSTSSLDTSGLVVDQREGSATAILPLAINGGSVTIESYNANLQEGSSINVSGGLNIGTTGKETFGKGGGIVIQAGQDPSILSVLGGQLELGASLQGYAGGKGGGSLSITAPAVQVGGTTTNASTLLLSPDFFNQGGFDSFTLTGLGLALPNNEFLSGVLIAPGTAIDPVAQSYIADLSNNKVTLVPQLLPVGVRGPVSLAFQARGASDGFSGLLLIRGDTVLGAGASIQTDPLGNVTLGGNTVTVLGSIIAPGGTITIKGGKDSTLLFPNQINSPVEALPTIDLGPSSFLSTAGTRVLTPDPSGRGYLTGSVLAGGSITVDGNIVAEAGSRLDVSGASGVLDLSPYASAINTAANGSFSSSVLVPTTVESNAGSITLRGEQELFTDALLIGNAGGPSVIGGNLSITSGIYVSSLGGNALTPLNFNLVVTQGGPVIPASFYPAGQTAIGNPVVDAGSNVIPGLGYVAVNDFSTSGFESISLAGSVQFKDPVTITAKGSINVGGGGVVAGDSQINLIAPYVAVGTAFQAPIQPADQTSPFLVQGSPFLFNPTYGTGSLNVTAGLIDIGNLSLQNIGTANFTATNGDIRGDGTLDVAGNITLTAGQIYPPTEVAFTIAAYNYQAGANTLPGTVTIIGSGNRQLPLSAGGELNIYASVINQGGELRAPIGVINLGWDGTGVAPIDPITGLAVDATQQLTLSAGSETSVSAVDPVTGQAMVIPYGINLNGSEWIDPSGVNITAGGVADKQINLSAANISEQSGAKINISGGGDLSAYRFVTGTGGSSDILASTSSYAVIPGYQAGYAPYAPYNTDAASNSNLGGDAGYVNGGLVVGDRIYLAASNGLPAGVYTLLPSRYALLPGAFLVTPESGNAVPVALINPDGSSIVPGYRIYAGQSGQPLYSSFEVDSQSVVQSRAEYDNFTANSFLSQQAVANNAAIPRLPVDSGQLVLAATNTMTLQGILLSQAPAGGLGSLVDIGSPNDIYIEATGQSGPAGSLTIDSASLSNFGAASLLVGGIRTTGANGTTVAVTTDNLTVDNAGSALTGQDVILVANNNLTLATGADVEATGVASTASQTLILGNSSTLGSGDGVLLRVSSNPGATITRSGVDTQAVQAALANPPTMTIGAGSQISGAGVTLDSTYSTMLDPSANITGQAVSLNSGQISIQLTNPGALYQPTKGLVLSDAVVQNLETNAQYLSLLSYSSIDIYGTGQIGSPSYTSLALHFSELRGFNNGGGTVTFAAQNIILDNSQVGTFRSVAAPQQGTIEFDAGVIQIGSTQLDVDQYSSELAAQAGSQTSGNLFNLNQYIDQYSQVNLNASGGILLQQTNATPQTQSLQGATVTGVLNTQGALTISTPLITGATSARQTIAAGGALVIQTPITGGVATITGGLGANLTLQGSSVTDNSNVTAQSGALTLRATSGDVVVGNLAVSRLDAGGTAQTFFDLVKYTSGGEINITSDTGSVILGADSTVTVAAQPVGGNAGSLVISDPSGGFTFAGTLLGQCGAGGENGSFSLDTKSLPSTAALDDTLNAAAFTQSRSFRVRSGDVNVDGLATAQTYNLSTDNGSITVTSAGKIDASGVTGGTIDLEASGSLVLDGGAVLTVAAQNFSDAGEGGAITLEAGSETNGNFTNNVLGTGPQLNIMAGSSIDLSVASNSASSAAAGDFTGKLHLRAPQTTGNTDLQIQPIDGTITGASSIIVEGYQVFNVTGTAGVITSTVQANVKSNGQTFAGNTTAITARLLGASNPYGSAFEIEPGAELINTGGNLTLGTLTSTSTSDWNLSSYRFGPNNVPGVLTLRASGNLVFYNALSDGFNSSANTATVMSQNTLLPANAQSWSFQLTSGADFTAADVNRVRSLSALLAANTGSLQIGKNDGTATASGGASALTTAAVANHFQVIRTGAGDITISAGLNVQLLNQFATIYTAGTLITTPTILPGGSFDIPVLSGVGGTTNLGAVQENPAYAVQYTIGGGNVIINAQEDILHETQNTQGVLIADSERELPDNWLYRRGYVNPLSGTFGVNSSIPGGSNVAESTTWWIDFSNFFEGVGALGGGNVTMTAGHDVTNVDGVVPTNARMPKGTPNAANLDELGGGDLVVRAGHDISGGVYYIERGKGILDAGYQIVTNSTRTPSLGILTNLAPYPSQTWLPTTLFLGSGSFDVTAGSDLLLGPVANPFLLPEGYSNTFWYKTYFSTYASTDSVNVSSLTGAVTLRESITLPGDNGATPILLDWLQNVNLLTLNPVSDSFYQPWLRLDESKVTAFTTVAGLLPPTLQVTAFSGDVNIVGNLTLSPSPTGEVDIAAAGSINGLQVNGVSTLNNSPVNAWSLATINLSDANPASIYGVANPFAYQVLAGTLAGLASQSANDPLTFLDSLFNESGSTLGTYGVIQTQQALHAPGPLHANDPDPVHLYAANGDISGITLFAGKPAEVSAGQDITDISLYVQNNNAGDITLVDAGRDIIAYDPEAPLLLQAQSAGNEIDFRDLAPAGDIQIGGPGTLEVLAGRNLTLGVGPNNSDGTGAGITSIGNARNPYLPFGGADIIAAAGVGSSPGLDAGKIDFNAFITQFLDPSSAGDESATYLPDLAAAMNLTGESNAQVWTAFQQLSAKQQDVLALDIFYLVLRDAGRDHNDASSSGFGNYAAGYAAIAALFPGNQWQGDISITSREIKTASGGNISILAPGGELTVGLQVAGTQAVDQGILTEDGGNISIFTNGNVNVGTSRIFTLRGGNEILWSSTGDIAAGASSKTVQSAPPTRVLIDPQSGAVQTDLAGLATGGGIGVLESVKGVAPGDVDLIAPVGTVDAGDAGIRVSGNLNISASVVLNASNIQVGGASVGTPVAPAAPNIGSLTAASNTAGASTSAATDLSKQPAAGSSSTPQEIPSIIDVEVLGYGGGDGLGTINHGAGDLAELDEPGVKKKGSR